MLVVHKTGTINKNLDSSATCKFWILPSFSLPPTPFCLSFTYTLHALILLYEFFLCLSLFFPSPPCFCFFTLPFPQTRPHSTDSQALIGKTATYFRADRTRPFSPPHHHHLFTWLPGNHTFCVSYPASHRSPSSALLCAHIPFLSQGYRLTMPASLCTAQAIKSLIKGARLSFQAIFKTMSFFTPS